MIMANKRRTKKAQSATRKKQLTNAGITIDFEQFLLVLWNTAEEMIEDGVEDEDRKKILKQVLAELQEFSADSPDWVVERASFLDDLCMEVSGSNIFDWFTNFGDTLTAELQARGWMCKGEDESSSGRWIAPDQPIRTGLTEQKARRSYEAM